LGKVKVPGSTAPSYAVPGGPLSNVKEGKSERDEKGKSALVSALVLFMGEDKKSISWRVDKAPSFSRFSRLFLRYTN
jgi:hypothetical protein